MLFGTVGINSPPMHIPLQISLINSKSQKNAIKSWLLTHRDIHQSRLLEIESLLQSLDVQAESCLLTPTQWQQKQDLRFKHLLILKGQEIYWLQRSRV